MKAIIFFELSFALFYFGYARPIPGSNGQNKNEENCIFSKSSESNEGRLQNIKIRPCEGQKKK
jgi:hypothetical protein